MNRTIKETVNSNPGRYSGLIRNRPAIYVMAVLFACLVAADPFFALNWLKDSRIVIEGPSPSYDPENSDTAGQISRIKKKIEELLIPEEMIRDLKNRSDFISTFMGGQPVRWSDLFEYLENVMPEKIWIEGLELLLTGKTPEFTIQGRTVSHKEVNNLWSGLQKSMDCQNVRLVYEKILDGEKTPLVSFEIKFEYAPVVRLKVVPSSINKVSGISQQFDVYGENVVGDDIKIQRRWLTWTLTPEAIGVIKNTGLFFGLRQGRGKVVVTTPDGTMEAYSDIVVED